jgi:hypothetical protein
MIKWSENFVDIQKGEGVLLFLKTFLGVDLKTF